MIRKNRNGGIIIEKRRKIDDFNKKDSAKSLVKKKKKMTKVVGLVNMSNYCFLNSCLQCLFSFDSLNEYFLSERYKGIKRKCLKKPKFILAYTDVLKIIKSTTKTKKNINLAGIQKLLRNYFNPAEQQDIHEFLRIFLSEMQEELTVKPRKEAKLGIFNEKNSIIEELFEGECLTRIICRNCKKYIEIYEKFMDLSLAIKRKKGCNIYDCLNRYISLYFRFIHKYLLF